MRAIDRCLSLSCVFWDGIVSLGLESELHVQLGASKSIVLEGVTYHAGRSMDRYDVKGGNRVVVVVVVTGRRRDYRSWALLDHHVTLQ